MNQEIIARLRHTLVPAVPVPFVGDEIDKASQERYAAWMSEQRVAGVAVWAHTGRGLFLNREQRDIVLSSWRRAMPGKLIVAGAGGTRDAANDEEYIASAIAMAEHARSLGADAILCYAPVRFRDRDIARRDALIIKYHEALASQGLPLILFYLYEAAGGISYSPEVLLELLQLDPVIGIKIATLDSIMTYQDVTALCKRIAPEKLVITGEDRFLGYSLMCGADGALIGMGAACTEMQAQFLASYYNGDLDRFHELNPKIDALAQATFTQPMEGYIARTSYLLAQQGIIAANSWQDPWGPRIEQHELAAIEVVMSQLRP